MGAHIPRGCELWISALFGAITLGIGNGGLTYAELWIPSGLSSLFIATSPCWFAGIDALLPKGDTLHAPTIRGMLVGSAALVFPAGPARWAGVRNASHYEARSGNVMLQVRRA